MSTRRLMQVFVAITIAATAGASTAASAAPASRPSSQAATVEAKKKPKASPAQIKALAAALGLPKSVVKRGLKGLEKADAEQEQSGPTALPADPALAIRHFTSFSGATDETIFVIKLAAAPEPDGVSYEYGLGVAIDAQPLSEPNPDAIEGFGRLALSRVLVMEPGGEVHGFNPAASFAPVESSATALVSDVFVVFRVPDADLGIGSFHLQAFGRDGDTAESPAGFTIVHGEVGS